MRGRGEIVVIGLLIGGCFSISVCGSAAFATTTSFAPKVAMTVTSADGVLRQQSMALRPLPYSYGFVHLTETASHSVVATTWHQSFVDTHSASTTNVFLPSSAYAPAVAAARRVVNDFAENNPNYVQAPKDVQRLAAAFAVLYRRGKATLRGTWADTVLTTLNHASSRVNTLRVAATRWAAEDYRARICLFNEANGSTVDCTPLIQATGRYLGAIIGEFGDAKEAYNYISGAQVDNNTFASQMG